MDTFGFSERQWNSAKREIREILVKRAKQPDNQTISYSDLVGQLKSVTLEPHDSRLNQLLCDVSSEESAAGRGMLSVLVVHKHGEAQPGEGFFTLARQLGRTGTNIEIWVSECERVLKFWRTPEGAAQQ